MRVIIHPDGSLYRWHVHLGGWGYTGLANSKHGAWQSVKLRYASLLEAVNVTA